MMKLLPGITLLLLIAGACSRKEGVSETATKPVAISLLGTPFHEPERASTVQAKLDSNLNIARKNFEEDPSEQNYIWYGRREGYLMHLDEAIAIFSEGLQRFPNSYQLLRHRGHRYISARKFELAVQDLHRAATLMPVSPLETEPDGAPNKLNIPLSNTQFNVWYHLGLAEYLQGDFQRAEESYQNCLATCENDDSRIAVLDWLYMIKRRLGKEKEAAGLLQQVNDSMRVIENDSYFQRLKMYKGDVLPETLLALDSTAGDYDLSLATQGYGVGNFYYCNGDTARAFDIYRSVVKGKLFAAFGFIAAEAELARLQE